MKRDLIRDLRKAFVQVLHDHDKLYHFDDDAHDICHNGKPQKKTFSTEEADVVNAIAHVLHSNELFDLAIHAENGTTYVPPPCDCRQYANLGRCDHTEEKSS